MIYTQHLVDRLCEYAELRPVCMKDCPLRYWIVVPIWQSDAPDGAEWSLKLFVETFSASFPVGFPCDNLSFPATSSPWSYVRVQAKTSVSLHEVLYPSLKSTNGWA